MLEDLPLPTDAQIVKAPTVLLGTGEAISGRIILTSGYSPAENLIFYGTETLTTGWQLISSKVGEEVTLIYLKNGRYATLEMKPRRTASGFIVGDVGSDIVISVVHPDAISNQNPYNDLYYNNLTELEKKEQLAKCRFMTEREFSDGVNALLYKKIVITPIETKEPNSSVITAII